MTNRDTLQNLVSPTRTFDLPPTLEPPNQRFSLFGDKRFI